MPQTVLLTGGSGFIGHHTVEHFLKNSDFKIVVLDNLAHPGNLNRLTDILIWPTEGVKRVRFVYHDFRAPFSKTLISQLGRRIDYIVHMGAETHVARSLIDPVSFAEANVVGTVNMLELARKLQPEKFIYISTDEVYGPTDGVSLHQEGEPHLPSNPYAASKAGGEDFVYSYFRSFGLPVVITNTMNNLGERQDPEKFLPSCVKKIMRGKEVSIHAKIVDGEAVEVATRGWLHARNHADAILFLLQRGEAGKRYNISGEQMSVLEMAQMVAEFLGRPLKVKYVDFHSVNPGHDMHYGLDSTVIHGMGWKEPLTLQESMEKAVLWIASRPEWLIRQ